MADNIHFWLKRHILSSSQFLCFIILVAEKAQSSSQQNKNIGTLI